jgi:hypothetical protein
MIDNSSPIVVEFKSRKKMIFRYKELTTKYKIPIEILYCGKVKKIPLTIINKLCGFFFTDEYTIIYLINNYHENKI